MSDWEDYHVENHVREILGGLESNPPGHHLGRPFLTAYQLAIEFDRRAPEIRRDKGWPIGGLGVGQHTSLAQYLARQLSRRIESGSITDIEGGFLSDLRLADLSFDLGRGGAREETLIYPSRNGPLSMFRYCG